MQAVGGFSLQHKPYPFAKQTVLPICTQMPPPAVHDDDNDDVKKGFAASKNMSYKRYQKAVGDTVSYTVK